MAIYGVANPLPAAAVYVTAGPGSDVSVTAASETTIITTGALTALNPGPYYPVIWLTAECLMGGTAASALVYAFKLGSGSDVDTYTVAPAKLVNSATVGSAICLVGTNSATSWVGSGSTINITCTSTGQNVTVKGVGTRAVVALFRGPDL
jgi:hypothetical protein